MAATSDTLVTLLDSLATMLNAMCISISSDCFCAAFPRLLIFFVICPFNSFSTGRDYLPPFLIQPVLQMEKARRWGLSYLILNWSA